MIRPLPCRPLVDYLVFYKIRWYPSRPWKTYKLDVVLIGRLFPLHLNDIVQIDQCCYFIGITLIPPFLSNPLLTINTATYWSIDQDRSLTSHCRHMAYLVVFFGCFFAVFTFRDDGKWVWGFVRPNKWCISYYLTIAPFLLHHSFVPGILAPQKHKFTILMSCVMIS